MHDFDENQLPIKAYIEATLVNLPHNTCLQDEPNIRAMFHEYKEKFEKEYSSEEQVGSMWVPCVDVGGM